MMYPCSCCVLSVYDINKKVMVANVSLIRLMWDPDRKRIMSNVHTGL